ncbi:metal-dependent hydrolase [Iningainema tapete]|uniref:Metal-dependent hydrolase n=1 Tax=Iningainema tapete BLCC-T55 TaxID=2748662 RepID=A0A8J6XPS0_9CYAN|nr:metal-dependent hydrolase [Iningainema tapete]MBD2775086.1 metal-dependent hydrolase [Iningainema tapete BLCC-T55]
MSSFIGHSLAALTVYGFNQPSARPKQLWWIACLIVIACFPDIDYLVSALRPKVKSAPADALSLWVSNFSGASLTTGEHTIRVTHSILSCLILPCLLIIILRCCGLRRRRLMVLSLQAVGAGFSHLLLDLLVGVTPTAVFWPLSTTSLTLPFGILPSAGRILLYNYYFYKNLFIELGVLVPICISVYNIRGGLRRTVGQISLLAILWTISLGFMMWAFSLER